GITTGNISNLEIKAGGTLTNNGTIDMENNLTNNGTPSLGSGTVTLAGSGTQIITGSSVSEFGTLQTGNDVELETDITVNQLLDLGSGKIDVQAHNLSLDPSGNISGHSSTSYIITDSTGRLIREVDNLVVEFPVGTSATYVPVILNNSGTVDTFKVNVFPDVLDDGLTGSTIPEIDNSVNMTWNIEEQTTGGSDLSVTVQWNATDEGSSFDRDRCGMARHNGTSWEKENEGPASGSGPYTRTSTGITSLSAFAVGDINSGLAQMTLTIDLLAFLEGPFNGASMELNLNQAGLVPLVQPYNTSPWNYSGGESVVTIPNTNVVDCVLVELRDAADVASGGIIIARKAAFLLDDGTIVDIDGNSPLFFELGYDLNLYAAVWHRNHLGIISANSLLRGNGVYSYDFSLSETQVYGGINGHKELATGIWGLTGGDGNADGQINNGDKNDVWAPQAGLQGYLAADYNMDKQVNHGDKNDILLPNSGRGCQVPAADFMCGMPFTDARDGQVYSTVQIGTQCWMAENLNIGTRIAGINDQIDNSIIEKYCYNDDEDSCTVFGGLYQWNEMMQYSITPGTLGICPLGWHVPSDAEWCTMETSLDPTMNCNILGWTGTNAGQKIKPGAISGFDALYAGHRNVNGTFGNFGINANFWCSDQFNSNDGITYTTYIYYLKIYRMNISKQRGYSVRCIKN
ncbi:MAG: hypothetical protein K8R53_09940, partial [Bacteroidales bacterium]|nr:hypothetical protein [Bacteroidales bacterium]